MMEKSQLPMRWLVLVLSCTLMIGNYYCFDNPAALKSQLQQHFSGELPADRFEFLFNMLYTLYSIPNIILPFFGGFLVDRLGARLCLMMFATAITVGQIVFAFGCSISQFNIMLLGRVLFGLGGESLGVAQSTLVASWFKNKELARLGSVFNNELSPVLATDYNVSSALWMGVVMCGVSLIAALILIPIDKRADAAIARTKSFAAPVPAVKDAQGFSLRDIQQFKPLFWLLAIACMVVYGCVIPFNNVASSLLMERDFFRAPPYSCRRCGEGAYADQLNCSVIAPGCPPVPPYSWPLPSLSRNCTIKEAADQFHCTHTAPYVLETSINCDDDAWKRGPFSAVYCAKKSAAAAAAATPMSVPYLISAILSPFMGYAVDRVGFRAALALVASLLLTVVHVLLGLTRVSYWVPLVLQGVAYCVFAAALWPSIPCTSITFLMCAEWIPDVVDARMVGSAYGAITSIQNLGLALFPLLVAMVYGVDTQYIPSVEMLFVAFGALGSVAGVALNVLDYKNGSILNRSSAAAAGTFDAEHTEALLDPNQTEFNGPDASGRAAARALNIGNSYCYDNPSALKSQLQERFHAMPLHEYEMYFNLLYSVYSIPNIILPFFGGYLTDRFGPRRVLFTTTLLITLGQAVFAYGDQIESFGLMLVGRVVFGLGGESIWVAQATLLSYWFPSNQLAFTNGVLLCISKLAAAFNNAASPVVAQAFGLTTALWIGTALCGLSLIAMLVLGPIDAAAQAHMDHDVLTEAQLEEEIALKHQLRPSDACQFGLLYWLVALLFFVIYAIVGPFNNVAGSVFMERDYYKALPAECARCGAGQYVGDANCSSLPPGCPPSPPFAHPLPLLSLACSDHTDDIAACAVAPPYVTALDIHCDQAKWKLGPQTRKYCAVKAAAEQASAAPLSIAPLVIALTAPVFGYVVDRIGCRTWIALGSMVANFVSQYLLGFTSISLYVPVVLQAAALSIFTAAMWPALSCCVEPHHVGTAYGVASAFLNVGLAVVPMFVVVEFGVMHVYQPYLNVIFMVFAALGIGLAAMLTYVDVMHHNGRLHAQRMVPLASMTSHEVPLDPDERRELLEEAHLQYGTRAAT
ncbi:Major Facilitator Superfamily (MFS) [Achlya hypogyna]|uniref:Lysosomal dipeptide transporter MFSD1 n=1 Tax=Achlya hypogyna TaxID=1202772 RepID=A0A1V9ZHK1_ACHHY|nr:Major Facilitator Superfamily (MFS) [Achlya hypogyna]